MPSLPRPSFVIRSLFPAVFAAMVLVPLVSFPAPVQADFYGQWTRLDSDPTLPAGRRAAASAYDSQRHRMIVFGGFPEYLNDVWAFDLATESWQQLVPAGVPPSPRYGASAIYDAPNDRVVVFGGFDGIAQRNDVWQLSLSGTPAWTLLSPAGGPPSGRSFHASVYDAPRQRMILFGGWSGSGFLGDTWQLSLSGSPLWTARAFSQPTPAARNLAGIAVDPAADRLVLFGGWSGSYRNDTWTLPLSSPSEWSPLITANTPPPRREISIAHDSVNERIVLFGGNDGTLRSDTWKLDLSGIPNWQQVLLAQPPPGRYGHNTIFDPVGQRIVIFGGLQGVGHSRDVWALDGALNGWSELSHALPNVRNHSLARDPVANRILLFGGERDASGSLSDGLFELDLSTDIWSRVVPASPAPSPRYAQRAVWDAARDRMLVFGGYDTDFRADLWEFKPRPTPTWTQLFPAGALPPPRFAGGFVLDAERDQLVVFGGYRTVANPTPPPSNTPIPMNDLWTLPLSGPGAMTWQEQSPGGTAPTPRWGHVMLMDAVRDRALVFGGGATAEATTAELFALDLASSPPAWSLIPSSLSPPGRLNHALAIDTDRDVLVLFGGYTSDPPGPSIRNDTWVFPLSGGPAGWWEIPAAFPTPDPRSSSGAIYDPAGQRLLVAAGFSGSANFLDDTWSFTWQQPVPTHASLVGFQAEPGRVRLDWSVREASSVHAIVERRNPGEAWHPLGTAVTTGLDRLSHEDRSVAAGMRYGYRLQIRDSGGNTLTDEVLVDVPAEHRLELAGAWPNPSSGDRLTIAFALAKRGEARIEILDVAGRCVARRDLSTLDPGRHRIPIEGRRLDPGVYVIRLVSEARVLTSKALVLR